MPVGGVTANYIVASFATTVRIDVVPESEYNYATAKTATVNGVGINDDYGRQGRKLPHISLRNAFSSVSAIRRAVKVCKRLGLRS